MEQQPESPAVAVQAVNFEPAPRRQISDTQRTKLAQAKEKAKEARLAKQRDVGVKESAPELSPIKEEEAKTEKAEAEPATAEEQVPADSEDEPTDVSPSPTPSPSPAKVEKKKAKRMKMQQTMMTLILTAMM